MNSIPMSEFHMLKDNVDQLFLIVMGMIILFMQCGFAFLEAGAVRSKNSTNILLKNLLDCFIAGIAYWLIGYPLAFGSGNAFLGYEYFASSSLPAEKFAFFFFQYVFAATASTIVSGSVAERCEFIAYIIYSFIITAFIYPVVTHWAWSSEGWLSVGGSYQNGTITANYQDFAGSGVVHIVGGASAFFGALLLGPRLGRFNKDTGDNASIRGHSVPLAALGGFILIFGFLAFNGGSEGAISGENNGEHVSLAVVNTVIAASFAAVASLVMNKTGVFATTNRWSLLPTLNGSLCGMVAACAGCNVYHPWASVILGIIAAFVYKFYSWLVVRLGVDDPLDAVAVHFGGGTLGVIFVSFFKKETGIVFAWDMPSGYSLAWQTIGLVSITGWAAILSAIMFGVLKVFGILRVPKEIEQKGLDIPKHGEPAYPVEAYGHGWVEKILEILETSESPAMKRGYYNRTVEVEVEDRGFYESPEVMAHGTKPAKANGKIEQSEYEVTPM